MMVSTAVTTNQVMQAVATKLTTCTAPTKTTASSSNQHKTCTKMMACIIVYIVLYD